MGDEIARLLNRPGIPAGSICHLAVRHRGTRPWILLLAVWGRTSSCPSGYPSSGASTPFTVRARRHARPRCP